MAQQPQHTSTHRVGETTPPVPEPPPEPEPENGEEDEPEQRAASHPLEGLIGETWYPADELAEVWGIAAEPPRKHLLVFLPDGTTDTRPYAQPEIEYREASTGR